MTVFFSASTPRAPWLATLMLLLAAATVPGSAAAADCDAKPGVLIDELYLALDNKNFTCDWDGFVDHSFLGSVGGGGSYNLPVIAAAIAYVDEPVRSGNKGWNMNSWWDLYLRGELGERGGLWYYGGQELGSGNYQFANIISVMTVHYQAWKVGNNSLRVLARRWLRATFAIHSLAAAPQRPKSFHDRGSNEPFSGYVGPYVAMAGMRSSENHWKNVNRSILFARAAEIPTNAVGEGPQGAVRTFLEANWAGPSGTIYGMTTTNQDFLRDVVNTGNIRPAISAMWNGIRTLQPIHFVGWQGVRVTLMEKNNHTSTAPTYGMVYFQQPRSATGREVHVLYPWLRSVGGNHRPFRNGITQGQATLNLSLRTLEATNVGPGEMALSPHDPETVTLDNLPTGPYQFHREFGPN
ncbi:MAG: hypothetical protein AAF560_25000 [Acidobacteriota bacterium]